MSQIPRSQFALKKRSTPVSTIPVLNGEMESGLKAKKAHTNGSSNGNGHKNGSYDNDVVIIEDDLFAVIGHEEVVATIDEPIVAEVSPKKKRSRKSKDSTESKDSDVAKKVVEEKPVEETPSEKELKIVKMSSDGLTGRGRRSDRLQNASTIVNLSTVSSSDQSTKLIGDDTLGSTPTERRVSGRRSTRPIDDIKFTYREPTADDSMNATTNATIGSDISMLATPGSKRPIDGSSENIDSPKRSRLDLSGLFSSFSSPVAILRNKFRRTNLASTPIVAAGAATLSESLEASSDMKEIDLNEKEEEIATDDKEELQVITTPVKKTSCNVM